MLEVLDSAWLFNCGIKSIQRRKREESYVVEGLQNVANLTYTGV